jgi:hypothetical protein
MIDSRKEIGDYIFVSKYARTVNGKKETWDQSVDRVMDMHYRHLADDMAIKEGNEKEIDSYLKFAERLYRDQVILGAQRALQYGGDSLLKNHSRNFNCTGSYIDRIEFFQELMHLLLCGAGAGYSVQRVHTEKLPKLKGVDEKSDSVNIVIDDSIEGWAFAVGEVVKVHYLNLPSINFDYSLIRPKGSFISGGFKAPGPEPLKKCIEKLNKVLRKIKGRKATPFELHRMACIIADAVISGGIRRSALLCQFDADDEEMLNCKTGNWFSEYPELARANNSAVILPNTPKETYDKIFKSIKEFGEPGLVFLSHKDVVYNPCCFTGDTMLLTSEGYRKFCEVASWSVRKDEYPLLLINKDGEKKQGRVWSNGYKHVIRLTFDSGRRIECTPDHRFMLQDGLECIASNLIGKIVKGFDGTDSKCIEIMDSGNIEEVYDFEILDEGHWGVVNGLIAHNCEVGMFPKFRNKDGVHESGFSFCNLTEINGSRIKTREQFLDACKGAAILGTIQASYTNFKVLSPVSRKIAERDALIGVGITGMCENPEILFDPQLQEEGARVVKETNRRVADLIGINHAARTTVIKPSGNSSQLLGCTSSGIHKFHFKRFIRNIQAANTEQALQHVKEVNPVMVRPSVYNKEGESVISFPVELDDNVLTSEDSSALDFLKLVKLTKEHWIEVGTNFDHPFYKEYPEMKDLRMNVSNTCTVRDEEWEEVREYVWKNRDVFSGISFLPKGGDLIYPQAPYTSVLDEKELAERYGAGAILAGGLIVDGLAVFNDDLWLACDVAMGRNNHHLILTDKDISDFILSHLKDGKLLVEVNGVMISDVNAISSHLQSIVDKKVDWVRRFKNFATKYLNGDLSRTEFCLKHVSLFHRWQKLKGMKHVDWESVSWNEEWVDAGSTVAQACSGGMCELK